MGKGKTTVIIPLIILYLLNFYEKNIILLMP